MEEGWEIKGDYPSHIAIRPDFPAFGHEMVFVLEIFGLDGGVLGKTWGRRLFNGFLISAGKGC